MIFRVRFKVEICERNQKRPRDWKEDTVSVDVEAPDGATALERIQAAAQTILRDGF